MTNKEKVLGLLQGEKTNGVVWAPRLKVWHTAHSTLGTLPEKYKGKSIVEIEKLMGAVAASSARISWKQRTEQPKEHIIQLKFNTVEIENRIEGNQEIVTYKTPIGSVSETILINYEAIEKGYPMQRHTHDHLIKEEGDYEIVEYIYKDMTFAPSYDNYLEFEESLGDHGVPIVQLDRDPMYLIMQNLIGYNQFFDTGITFIDCFATAPMVPTTLDDAVSVWGNRVVIYGGIPSNMLMPDICSDEDYNNYLDDLFKTIKEKPCRILLGVADNVMPEADIDRLEMITDRVAASP